MIWLCITSLCLSLTLVMCDQHMDTSLIRIFPAANKSIAGVFQVSRMNHLNQPEYAFNASDARRLCVSLSVNMASKAQVQEALSRGLETCRFGWIDEHFAVIPRRRALSSCGQNQTGLVPWRASVTKKFDVFCFNESDAATQLKAATAESPTSTSPSKDEKNSPQTMHSSSYFTLHPPSSSASVIRDSEVVAARFVGSAKGSTGGKAVLITSCCAVLLIAIVILAYVKMRRRWSQQQHKFTEEVERTCVQTEKVTDAAPEEDERIDDDNDDE